MANTRRVLKPYKGYSIIKINGCKYAATKEGIADWLCVAKRYSLPDIKKAVDAILKMKPDVFWQEYYSSPDDSGWEFLEKYTDPAWLGSARTTMYDYLHGYCDTFSAVLNRKYGYRVYNVTDKKGNLHHSYAVDSSGMYVDIRGKVRSWYDLMEDFEDFLDIHDPHEFLLTPVDNETCQRLLDDTKWSIAEQAEYFTERFVNCYKPLI